MVLVTLAGGAVYDLKEHRIPNWWVFGMTGLGLGFLWWLSASEGKSSGAAAAWQIIGWYFLRCLIVTAICFPLFYCRMMGAGDIKLMAFISGFLGFRSGGKAILISFLIGAAMALVKLLLQGILIQRLKYLYAYFKRLIMTKEAVPYHSPLRDGYEHTIPFGLCLFLGTLLSVIL